MEFQLNAELDEFELRQLAGQTRESDDDSRARFIHALFAELAGWQSPEDRPPKLNLHLTGNFKKPSTIRTSFSIDAEELTRNGYQMEKVHVAGEFLGRHLTFDTFQFFVGSKRLGGSAAYDLKTREGRYEIQSAIQLSQMLRINFG